MRTNTNYTKRSFATIQTLVLLSFLLALIAVAVRHNVTQRRYLRLREAESQALSLAESGAEEALHRLAAGPESGAAERRLGSGGFRAEWRGVESVPGAFDIVSTAWAGADTAPQTAGRVVRVRAALTRPAPTARWRVQVLSWQME